MIGSDAELIFDRTWSRSLDQVVARRCTGGELRTVGAVMPRFNERHHVETAVSYPVRDGRRFVAN